MIQHKQMWVSAIIVKARTKDNGLSYLTKERHFLRMIAHRDIVHNQRRYLNRRHQRRTDLLHRRRSSPNHTRFRPLVGQIEVGIVARRVSVG